MTLARGHDVVGLPLPTPFAIGHVNVYLLEDDPLTLVDTGPNWGTTLGALERGLADHGRRLEDVELVLITHQHADHLGLTEYVVQHSGAAVACLAPLAPYVEDFRAYSDRDDELAAHLMRRHGVDPDLVDTLRAVTRVSRAWGSSFRVDRVLRPGDEVQLRDHTLRVLHRPGHSPTDTLFVDEEQRLAFVGDHLLAAVSSNALIALPQPGDAPPDVVARHRPRSLVAYLESLVLTRQLDLDVLYGGHGEPVLELRGLIDERFAHHERRLERIQGLLGRDPVSAHAIAREMWGATVAVTQTLLTLSEVLGHLDVLVDRGLAVEHADDRLTTFTSR